MLDKGCGISFIVGILWLAGIFPGVIAALVINLIESPPKSSSDRRYVEIPADDRETIVHEKPKHKGAFVRLADGEVAEVIDDDGVLPEKFKRDDYL